LSNRVLVILLAVILLFTNGCATVVRTSSALPQRIQQNKTIAILPPGIEVYKFMVGDTRELIDEWTNETKRVVIDSLQTYFKQNTNFEIKLIQEDWLKQNAPDVWRDEKTLYQAVASSAYLHAFNFAEPFPTKRQVFDYTVGSEINQLARTCGADYLLFVYGFDHEATTGRKALLYWNVLIGAVTGVVEVPLNPSLLMVGLVDGKTGDVDYLKVTPPEKEYSFRNQKAMEKLAQWMIEDLLEKK